MGTRRKHPIPEIGQQFGRMIVKKIVTRKGTSQVAAYCECENGHTPGRNIHIGHLHMGHNVSCRQCVEAERAAASPWQVGSMIGKQTVVDIDGNLAMLQCPCGYTRPVKISASYLNNTSGNKCHKCAGGVPTRLFVRVGGTKYSMKDATALLGLTRQRVHQMYLAKQLAGRIKQHLTQSKGSK